MQDVERIREVLAMIVCPACHERLELRMERPDQATQPASFTEGCVRCVGCRKSYPIEDGIPVLLIERAQISE